MSTGYQPTFEPSERLLLLKYARDSVMATACYERLPVPGSDVPTSLQRERACFVTLYKRGDLRGCTGVLQARQSLIREVIETASSTASSDPRFSPVMQSEVSTLLIEISVLTDPKPLTVQDQADLPLIIRPGTDGVTLYIGHHRSTFLPQVWQKIPDPTEFLGKLCEKMGKPYFAWRESGTRAEIYQVEEFSETSYPDQDYGGSV